MTDLFSAATYNPAGALVTAGIGPGVTVNRSYNKRFLPVSETDFVKATAGMASVQVTGIEQVVGYSTGSITFTGSEQSTVSDGSPAYDGGLFIVSINGGNAYQVQYGQSSTPQTLAATLAAAITCSYGPVQAVASGGTVYLISCAMSSTDQYSIQAYFDGNDSSQFPTPSFSVSTSGPTMTQAPGATAASGPVSVITFFGTAQASNSGAFTIEFNNASTGAMVNLVTVSWTASSTPQSLAASLVAGLPSCSGGGVISAVQDGSSVTLGYCNSGGNDALAVNLDYGAPGTAAFSALVDGKLVSNAGLTYDSGTATLVVNGTQVASTTYGSTSKPSSIVAGLVTAGKNNTLVTLSAGIADPSYLTITALQASEDSYSYSLSFTHSPNFTQESFAASVPNGQLEGGQNAPLYNWAINSYAANGDVLSVSDSVMGTWAYAYDDLNRLVTGRASAGSMTGLNLSWDYDRYGNRWDQNASGSGSAVQTHFTFSGNNNRIDQYSSSYDPDGNLKSDGTNSYVYDAENRIITLNGQPTYIYDAEGRRVAKYSGGSITSTYILGLGGQQITEMSGSGAWKHSNVFTAGGRLLGTYEGPGGSAVAGYHFNLTDWLGTKRMQTSNSGTEDEICVSYPFGDGLSCTGPAAVDATEQHFTGKERDAESGLDYFGARYLSSNFGRFMTPDWAATPIDVPYAKFGDPQTLNLYAYVSNNPNTGVDADGHFGNEATGAAAADAAVEAGEAAFGTATLYPADPGAPGGPPAPDSGSDPSSGTPAQQQSESPAGGGGKTIDQIGQVVYQETRPMSDDGTANESLTTARERIADVYLNGNHKMAPGTNKAKTPQEKAALADSIQATKDAVAHRAAGNDITGGATKYNQSPTDHSGKSGGGAFCPNSCQIKSSSGPYVNGNPQQPVQHWINIYQ